MPRAGEVRCKAGRHVQLEASVKAWYPASKEAEKLCWEADKEARNVCREASMKSWNAYWGGINEAKNHSLKMHTGKDIRGGI